MSKFKVMLLGSVAAGLTLGTTSGVIAGEVEKSASTKGHVARLIGTQDDGGSATLQHQDSDRSGSRFYMIGKAKSESMEIGAVQQIRLDGEENNSPTSAGGGVVSLANSYVYVKNAMGTLSLGDKTNASSMNLSGSSLSGAAGLGARAHDAPFNNTFTTANNGTDEENAGSAVGHDVSFSSDVGNGVHYNSPSFNGFTLDVSIGGSDTEGGLGERWGSKVKYSGDFNGTAVKAHGQFANIAGDDTATDAVWNVGVGFELASGINFDAGYGQMEMATGSLMDPEAYQISIGYDSKEFSSMGETSVQLVYGDQSEVVADTGDWNQVALNIEQDLSDYGTSIFGGIAKQEYSISGTDYEDVTTTWLGMKVSF